MIKTMMYYVKHDTVYHEGVTIMANVRSPNYPAISLPEAVKRIAMIYKQEQRHPADKEVIAKHIGYGSLNGGSNAVISALAKYGLLVPTGKGDQLKLSEEALDIIIHDRGEPDRVKAIQKTAFTPSLFNELYGLYGANLPSGHSLRSTLLKRGFNEKTVDSVIRAFRDTIEFVNMETEGSNMESVDEPQETLMQTQTPKQASPDSGNTVRSDLAPSPSLDKGLNESEYVLTFKPAQNIKVRVEITSTGSGTLTQDAFQKTIKHLQLDMDGYPEKVSVEGETDHHEHDSEV